MKFIEGGIELTWHAEEINIRSGNGIELKVIFRDVGHGPQLYLFRKSQDRGYDLIIANQEGFWSTDHTAKPTTKLEAYGTFPYQA